MPVDQSRGRRRAGLATIRSQDRDNESYPFALVPGSDPESDLRSSHSLFFVIEDKRVNLLRSEKMLFPQKTSDIRFYRRKSLSHPATV